MPTTVNGRNATYPVDPMFLQRWSPRAFTGEAMPQETLMTILEAGHWAASSSNSQPWRFVYALRNTEHWNTLLGLLVPFNQGWAKNASALVFVASMGSSKSPKSGEMQPLPTHSFDTGAAAAYMALQALKLGWHAHGMYGFEHERAPATLHIPENARMEAAFAFGKLGDKASLPEDLQARETPSDRMPLDQVAFEGEMK